jgi:hypothetical protein
MVLRGDLMFSDRYEVVWEEVSELSRTHPEPLDLLQPQVASDFIPFLWSEGFGLGGELDRAIVLRSAEVKTALYGGRVFVIAPIYVSSICQEQCLYRGTPAISPRPPMRNIGWAQTILKGLRLSRCRPTCD